MTALLCRRKKSNGETQVLQHHQLPELQNYSRVTGGEGGKAEYDFDPD